MEADKEYIETTKLTKLMLQVIADRCNYSNVGALLQAIAEDIDLSEMIEDYLKFQAENIEFF